MPSDDVTEVLRTAESVKPQVVVMDTDVPGFRVFQMAEDIARVVDPISLLFLTSVARDGYIDEALRLRAGGMVTTTSEPNEVTAAIDSIAKRQRYFSPDVASRLVAGDRRRTGNSLRTRGSTISTREHQVLRLIAHGMSKRSIAERLGLSVKTIDNHATSIMNKLDIHDRVNLARYAFREGLAEP
ncbi:MAG: response regulator transcription factor [Planctomycetota bacterium]